VLPPGDCPAESETTTVDCTINPRFEHAKGELIQVSWAEIISQTE